ncbi:MAG TPA: hypothetical protein VFD32_00545, partial [Dehalococcoidia bacterium]|nr:hypothetical protein [Dehalococcoidia bacterium]
PRFAMLRGEAPIWAALLPAAAFEAAALRLSTIPADPDYWWHLATGRWLLDHGQIPTSDPFSFSRAGQNWYAHEWLGELLIGAADRIAGYAACILLTAVFFALACWLTWRAVRYYGVSSREASLFVIGGSVFLLRYLAVRPQVWTWPLFALLIHELIAYYLGRRRRLWHIPALFAIWVNVHLSALIGLAALGLYALVALLRWLNARGRFGAALCSTSRGDERQMQAAFQHIAGVGVLSLLALSANPRGPALVWFSRLYLNQNAVYYRYINEWQHLSFSGFDRITYLVGGALVTLTLVASWRHRSLWPGLLALAFAWAAMRAVRYVPLFALVGVPVAGWLTGHLGSHKRATVAVPVKRGFVLLLAGTMLVALLIVAPALPGTQFRREARGDAGGFPVGATAWLKMNMPDARLFNDYDWGGYLLNAFDPGRQVYIDGRTEMYGERFFDRYVQAVAAEPGWQRTLADSGAEAVLLKPTDPLAIVLARDAGWRPLYRDGVSVLYAPAGTGR